MARKFGIRVATAERKFHTTVTTNNDLLSMFTALNSKREIVPVLRVELEHVNGKDIITVTDYVTHAPLLQLDCRYLADNCIIL